ncbi:MAG: hypothetical protein FRX49_12290 [Trebouxia sp. A1-2]|nr:MAG: hypothetical protein FRX49_12290 [Trebouxia sp. A1-2]
MHGPRLFSLFLASSKVQAIENQQVRTEAGQGRGRAGQSSGRAEERQCRGGAGERQDQGRAEAGQDRTRQDRTGQTGPEETHSTDLKYSAEAYKSPKPDSFSKLKSAAIQAPWGINMSWLGAAACDLETHSARFTLMCSLAAQGMSKELSSWADRASSATVSSDLVESRVQWCRQAVTASDTVLAAAAPTLTWGTTALPWRKPKELHRRAAGRFRAYEQISQPDSERSKSTATRLSRNRAHLPAQAVPQLPAAETLTR